MSGGRPGVGGAHQKPVIVGFDGSEDSRRAVQWAARHAVAAGLSLVVAHCWVWPLFTQNLGPVTYVEDSGLQREAEKTAAEGLELALQTEPDVDASVRLVAGFPSEMLTRLSTEASLVVTGTRGLGGFAGLLVGSVSLHLAASASCPIAVIRDEHAGQGDVLVGVDGSPESERAVLTAVELARTLQTSLRVLHVRAYGRNVPARLDEPSEDPIIQQALGLLPPDSDLGVTVESLSDPSVPGVIVHHARGSACVVLGAKGRNTIGARLGSAVHAVLHHAKGNVIVVR